jgi:hypothetical protein
MRRERRRRSARKAHTHICDHSNAITTSHNNHNIFHTSSFHITLILTQTRTHTHIHPQRPTPLTHTMERVSPLAARFGYHLRKHSNSAKKRIFGSRKRYEEVIKPAQIQLATTPPEPLKYQPTYTPERFLPNGWSPPPAPGTGVALPKDTLPFQVSLYVCVCMCVCVYRCLQWVWLGMCTGDAAVPGYACAPLLFLCGVFSPRACLTTHSHTQHTHNTHTPTGRTHRQRKMAPRLHGRPQRPHPAHHHGPQGLWQLGGDGGRDVQSLPEPGSENKNRAPP